eukprot:gene4961-5767_t
MATAVIFVAAEFDYVEGDASIVTLSDGTIQGVVSKKFRAFYGIPFAAPPVKTRRWKDPEPVEPWESVRPAKSFQAGCIQACNLGEGVCPETTSEDCLYLDVYTPVAAAREDSPLMPVMVFIPGGAYNMGGGGVALYNASSLVSKSNMIVVNINYRLGVLGFLGAPDLSGNYGFMDMIAALEWVRDNIAAFGGDPAQVTLAGQSAGAMSVNALMVSPRAEGLFHRVIGQSIPSTIGFKTKKSAEKFAEKFAKETPCSVEDIPCLLRLSATEVLAAQVEAGSNPDITKLLDTFTPWSPVIEDGVIPDQTLDVINSGKFNNVPMMIGSVQDEGILFVHAVLKNKTGYAIYLGLTSVLFPINGYRVRYQYPAKLIGDSRPVMSRLVNDYLFSCPARIQADIMIELEVPTYHYKFVYPTTNPMESSACHGKACHGAELPYVFNTFSGLGGWVPSPEEQALSNEMGAYWSNFVISGNPNTGLPTEAEWPEWSDGKLSMVLDTPPNVQNIYANKGCDLFDKIGYHGQLKA